MFRTSSQLRESAIRNYIVTEGKVKYAELSLSDVSEIFRRQIVFQISLI